MKAISILVAALLAVSLSAQAKHIELNSSNMVAIRSEINDESVSDAQIQLIKLVAKRGSAAYTIYLVLDSPGGDITSGLNFIEFTKTIKNLETVTLFAASMASAIVEHLPGKRNITESGILMFHRAKGGLQGQFEDGELESRLNFYKDMVRNMEKKSAERMSTSLASYKASVKDELWILGKDAVTKKAADDIVTLSCSLELANSPIIQSINFLGMVFKLEMNGCPMIKGMKLQSPTEKTAEAFNKYVTKFRQGV